MSLKVKLIRSEKHRRFIASLPCAVSGKSDCQAAHIRAGAGGMGLKPGDDRCIPLNWEVHAAQHKIGERKFWANSLDDAIQLAADLYENTGDYDTCQQLIARFRVLYSKN